MGDMGGVGDGARENVQERGRDLAPARPPKCKPAGAWPPVVSNNRSNSSTISFPPPL